MSVEMELDQYLSDSNSGTGILEYWQVNLLYFSHEFAKQENTIYLVLAVKLP